MKKQCLNDRDSLPDDMTDEEGLRTLVLNVDDDGSL
jgi:hypothetical protein